VSKTDQQILNMKRSLYKIMMNGKKEQSIIKTLKLAGLKKNESIVFYELIKSGPKGTIVKILSDTLNIKRTTLYSIIKKFEKKGFVKEIGNSSQSKGATIFVAIRPLKFFNLIISKKKKELEELEELSLMYSDRLEEIYHKGIEYNLDDIHEDLKPYFRPLLENDWKIISYIAEFKTTTVEHDTFDCKLKAPHSKFFGHVGFLWFKFDYSIENDEIAQKYFMRLLKRKGKEEILFNTDLEDIKLIETKVHYYGIEFPAFLMDIDLNLISKSKDFSFLGELINKNPNLKTMKTYSIGISVMITIKDQMFVLWGESKEILKQCIDIIFKVNQISKISD